MPRNQGFQGIARYLSVLEKWPPALPQTGALTELRYAPTLKINTLRAAPLATFQELGHNALPTKFS